MNLKKQKKMDLLARLLSTTSITAIAWFSNGQFCIFQKSYTTVNYSISSSQHAAYKRYEIARNYKRFVFSGAISCAKLHSSTVFKDYRRTKKILIAHVFCDFFS